MSHLRQMRAPKQKKTKKKKKNKKHPEWTRGGRMVSRDRFVFFHENMPRGRRRRFQNLRKSGGVSARSVAKRRLQTKSKGGQKENYSCREKFLVRQIRNIARSALESF